MPLDVPLPAPEDCPITDSVSEALDSPSEESDVVSASADDVASSTACSSWGAPGTQAVEKCDPVAAAEVPSSAEDVTSRTDDVASSADDVSSSTDADDVALSTERKNLLH